MFQTITYSLSQGVAVISLNRPEVMNALTSAPSILDSAGVAPERAREILGEALAGADPAEAERLLELGQEQVARRWSEYEELATREAQDFAADARKEG